MFVTIPRTASELTKSHSVIASALLENLYNFGLVQED